MDTRLCVIHKESPSLMINKHYNFVRETEKKPGKQ